MPRLLLVDDDISEITAVKRVLSRSGLAPLLATSGPDAAASVGQARPDLILLGAACHDGEALQAIRQLDEDPATGGIPLIILGESADAPERAVQLPRPVDPAELAAQVKRLLAGDPSATPFERRTSAPTLPGSMERRTGPSDPTLARKAAAEALLLRARELRGGGQATAGDRPARRPSTAPAEAAAGLDALFELAPPAGVGARPPPIAETPFDLPPVPPLDLDLEAPASAPTVLVPPEAWPPQPEPEPAPAPAPEPAPDWARAHAEEQAARLALEEELRQLRQQRELDRRQHDEALQAALSRATAHGQATPQRRARDAEAPAPFLADVPPPDPDQAAARRRALSRRASPDAGPEAGRTADPSWAGPALGAPPAELRGGTLDDLPMTRLLAVAWKAQATGRLDVVGDASRALWFEDGRVVGAASNAAGERLDEVALRLGLLTRDQHRQVAGAAAGLASRRAAVLLVDRGYLKSGELTPLVRSRTEEVVFGIFAEGTARFRWISDPVPADERITLDRPPLALAVEGVRRRWLAPRTEAILGGPSTLVTPVHGGPSADELGLLPEEQRALAAADGLRTLDEVLAQSPLDALSTRQLLSALVLVGALGVKVVQAGRPVAQVSAGIDLARVKEKLEQVRRADYFTILGLGRVATPHEVRAAAERLTAEYQAERFRGLQEEGLPARLEEIRRVVADAREVLADPFLREEYQRGLAT